MSIEKEKARLLKNIYNYEHGNANIIPCPFESFKDYWFGITRKRYYLITSGSKGAKTQTASFLFLYWPILYAYEHQDQIKLKIKYFSMEEDITTIKDRFYSFLLRKIGNMRYGSEDLECFYNKLPTKIVNMLFEEEPYKSIIQFFEDTVSFEFDNTSESINKTVMDFARENGEIIYNEKEEMCGYKPYDPKTWLMTYSDHVSMVETLPGQTLKQAIDSVDKTLVRTRNICDMIHVVVQQQNSQNIDTLARKNNYIEPTQAGLCDTQNVGKSADITFGIVNPYSFELKTYRKYKVYDEGGLYDHCRFIKVVLARKDIKVAGAYCNLFFDGRTCFFSELPPAINPTPQEKVALEEIYKYVSTIIPRKREVLNTLNDIKTTEEGGNSTVLLIFSKIKRIMHIN